MKAKINDPLETESGWRDEYINVVDEEGQAHKIKAGDAYDIVRRKVNAAKSYVEEQNAKAEQSGHSQSEQGQDQA